MQGIIIVFHALHLCATKDVMTETTILVCVLMIYVYVNSVVDQELLAFNGGCLKCMRQPLLIWLPVSPCFQYSANVPSL